MCARFCRALPSQRTTDTGWGKLMNHEMASPTPIATWIFTEAVVPRIMFLRNVIAELLDFDPTDPRVAAYVTSVQARCLFYRPDPFKNSVIPGCAPSDDAAVGALAEHIVQFSLAGIRAIRNASRRTR